MEQTKRKLAKSKKHKSKIKAEKREKRKVKKGKQWRKNGIVHLHLFCIYCAFSFFFDLFCFLPGKKKQNKMQNKSQKNKSKKQNTCQKMQMDKSIFSIFFSFLTFLFSPIYFASGFFHFLDCQRLYLMSSPIEEQFVA